MPRHAPELECSDEDKAILATIVKSGMEEARAVAGAGPFAARSGWSGKAGKTGGLESDSVQLRADCDRFGVDGAQMHGTRTNNAAAAIRDLAERYAVVCAPTTTDAWAQQITRLAGDDVEFDHTEWLLIALQRAGHISRADAVLLQADSLAQVKP